MPARCPPGAGRPPPPHPTLTLDVGRPECTKAHLGAPFCSLGSPRPGRGPGRHAGGGRSEPGAPRAPAGGGPDGVRHPLALTSRSREGFRTPGSGSRMHSARMEPDGSEVFWLVSGSFRNRFDVRGRPQAAAAVRQMCRGRATRQPTRRRSKKAASTLVACAPLPTTSPRRSPGLALQRRQQANWTVVHWGRSGLRSLRAFAKLQPRTCAPARTSGQPSRPRLAMQI